MEPHGVPSGGDWGLERLGALYFEGTEGLSVRGCQFERLDVRASTHSVSSLFSSLLFVFLLSSFCFGQTVRSVSDIQLWLLTPRALLLSGQRDHAVRLQSRRVHRRLPLRLDRRHRHRSL